LELIDTAYKYISGHKLFGLLRTYTNFKYAFWYLSMYALL